ncbi:uncharacterized protein [Fopius arisanus]|uniref:Uncharacterized protein n=1 Tax=Fopius arisanus TaxID=64838 RepID=A0A9R1SX12_9HYME|nr:PREDICTED: uncharacterized protein LOC105263885 [Fopius arisanus]
MTTIKGTTKSVEEGGVSHNFMLLEKDSRFNWALFLRGILYVELIIFIGFGGIIGLTRYTGWIGQPFEPVEFINNPPPQQCCERLQKFLESQSLAREKIDALILRKRSVTDEKFERTEPDSSLVSIPESSPLVVEIPEVPQVPEVPEVPEDSSTHQEIPANAINDSNPELKEFPNKIEAPADDAVDSQVDQETEASQVVQESTEKSPGQTKKKCDGEMEIYLENSTVFPLWSNQCVHVQTLVDALRYRAGWNMDSYRRSFLPTPPPFFSRFK